jgi:hypothetical protein
LAKHINLKAFPMMWKAFNYEILQFVDKRGSELKNSEPLLKFPLKF